jgi:formylmethanofuran:tetrahydromethanopterin formyltransferase
MISAIAASNSAVAASDAAWAAVNAINVEGIIITPSLALPSGSLPTTQPIFEKKPNSTNEFYYHAPTIKLKTSATVSVGELNVSANTY